MRLRKQKVIDPELIDAQTAVQRLEILTERIQTAAEQLENLVVQLKSDEVEVHDGDS